MVAKPKKLSDRALTILRHIADRSAGGHKWLPGDVLTGDYDSVSGCYLRIGGAGDAAILRGLVSSGLLRRDAPESDCSNQYNWLVVTIDGLMRVADESERVGTIRAALKHERRRREHQSEKSHCRDAADREQLARDYPEFYADTHQDARSPGE